jgi:predicted negative regulator of RcsB-dependent stress response
MTEEYLTDDEQLEAVKQIAAEYAPWLIGGVLVGALAFFGIQYFKNYTNERALKAATQFSALAAALKVNDEAKSRQIAEGLIKDYASSPYADQAQLTLARLDVDDGQLNKAIAPLTQVMHESKDTELRQVARLRLARVLIDQGQPAEAIKTLPDPLSGAFAAPSHAVRGDAYLATKDKTHALSEYQAALAATDSSGINPGLLELKIQDLGGAPAAPIQVISADTLNKAKH